MSAPHGLLPSTCPSSGSSPLEGLLAPLRSVMACEMRGAQVLHSVRGYLGPRELPLQLSFLPEEQDFQGMGGRVKCHQEGVLPAQPSGEGLELHGPHWSLQKSTWP